MTLETRLVFELEDIKNIRIVCSNEQCQGEIALPPRNKMALPDQCPHCGKSWEKTISERRLLAAINTFLELEKSPLRLKFESAFQDDE